ncbi:FAD-dependent oxidoreductase [Actinomadura madurae]|uniref:FAD-dependent oxidoreductase n=1 Tax=Actinomadura madurae TaxID=1993 RepID=UPI0020D20110|nr:NAD(P)/FAD-dependent oxidoreductase [Actinomadura madurae]MCQ0003513.1 NAD(P)/FAD-dependent oxidoreductase [Actinomadura madurae]
MTTNTSTGTCRDSCFDVAVIGAGPAGLSAAASAAAAGAATICIDGQRRPGGQYYRQPAGAAAASADRRQRSGAALYEAAVNAGSGYLPGTGVWGLSEDPHTMAVRRVELVTDGRLSQVSARSIVVAAGARERCAAFPGWTLPGVLTAGGVQALYKQHRIVPGKRILLAGSGPLLLVVAAAMARAGGEVAAVVEAARVGGHSLRHPWSTTATMVRQPAKIWEGARSVAALARHGVRVRTGWGVVQAHGRTEVTGATIARLDRQWRPVPGTHRYLDCDTIAIHHGLVPATEVLQLLGVPLSYQPALGGHVPVRDDTMATDAARRVRRGRRSRGRRCRPGSCRRRDRGCRGGGPRAGHALLHGRPHQVTTGAAAPRTPVPEALQRAVPVTPRSCGPCRPDTPLCRCENVPEREVSAAINAGATTVTAVKSLTRCGMGNCQGRVCAPLIQDCLTRHLGPPPEQPPPLRARTPLEPVPLSAFASEAGP